MSKRAWWRRIFCSQKSVVPHQKTVDATRPDLREFIYLDEVSLLSLLASQKGEITDSKSEQASEGNEASVDGTAGGNPGFIAKAEIKSRYQTTNSSTIQTSRKATVQSRFRDLHEIGGLRIIEPIMVADPAKNIDGLKKIDNPSKMASTNELQRGSLIEVRVCLGADPIFHLGTMVSEFTALSEDYPDMFAAERGLAMLREVQPINKILQRLLAGLVPIRAIAVDYVVADIDDTEYIVHKKLIEELDLKVRPLEIVGVTEQEAYWKDLRRVLFSDAEFTVFARISRSGLHDSWTPVKLADLFTEVAPNLIDQINAAGRVSFSKPVSSDNAGSLDLKLANALTCYKSALLNDLGVTLTPEQEERITLIIDDLKTRSVTVSDQTSAFSVLTKRVLEMTDGEVTPAKALDLRTAAREEAGLSFFPQKASSAQIAPTVHEKLEDDNPRLLDVDFVAIYW